jgi:hypothetical protein
MPTPFSNAPGRTEIDEPLAPPGDHRPERGAPRRGAPPPSGDEEILPETRGRRPPASPPIPEDERPIGDHEREDDRREETNGGFDDP